MSRDRPDGASLQWRLTRQAEPDFDGLVPFLIDWGAAESPAVSAPGGCTLVELRGEHPQAERVAAALTALAVPLPVRPGPEPRLIAVLATPRGRVELR